jgi:hypothetical protein
MSLIPCPYCGQMVADQDQGSCPKCGGDYVGSKIAAQRQHSAEAVNRYWRERRERVEAEQAAQLKAKEDFKKLPFFKKLPRYLTMGCGAGIVVLGLLGIVLTLAEKC